MSVWVPILVALIAAAPPSALAWLAWKQSRKNHHTMNSRLDELVKIASSRARARGRMEGIAEGKRTKKQTGE